MGAYYTEQELWFSALYGGAVYRTVGETGSRPASELPKRGGKGGKTSGGDGKFSGGVSRGNAAGISLLPPDGAGPLLENLTTGERVRLRRLPDGADISPGRILNPPPSDLALWPADLLPLSTAGKRNLCTVWADHAYVPEDGGETADRDDRDDEKTAETDAVSRGPVQNDEAKNGWALAFPDTDRPGLREGQAFLDSLGPLNWKNGAARSAALHITEAVERLNRNGWLWQDFHPSRLFFRENGQVFFDYSNLTTPAGEETTLYRPGNYPVEFGDPAVIRGIISRPDGRSQNYSLCALLFYLLFGRLPCDGTLLAGCPDSDLYNHYVKFRDYHRMPIFLFDPEDDRNTPGVFAEDEELTALWRECPEELRRVFTDALCRASAERRGGQVSAPGDLLDCFARLGWEKTESHRKTGKHRH